MEEEKSFNLVEILFALLRKIKLIILLTVLCAVFGFGFSKYFITKEYTSSISMYVKNSSTQATDTINATDIMASQDLVNTYIVVLKNDVVLDQIGEKLLADYDTNDLAQIMRVDEQDGKSIIYASTIRNLITMQAEDSTEVLKISAKTANPQVSADICNYFSEIAPELLTRVTRAGSVETIGSAKVPTAPSSPSIPKYAALGGFFGFVLSIIIALFQFMMDHSIKSGDDLKAKYTYPVLGEIPDLFSDMKGGSKKYEYYSQAEK